MKAPAAARDPAYWSSTWSSALRQPQQNGTSFRENMMQSTCGAVGPLGLVVRPLEGAHLAGEGLGRELRASPRFFCSRKSASISDSGPLRLRMALRFSWKLLARAS